MLAGILEEARAAWEAMAITIALQLRLNDSFSLTIYTYKVIAFVFLVILSFSPLFYLFIYLRIMVAMSLEECVVTNYGIGRYI